MQGPLNERQIASQSDQQAGTSANVFVAPSVQQQHKSAIKAWAHILLSGTVPTLITGYNIATVSGPATGMINIAFTNAMASAFYTITADVITTSGSSNAATHLGTSTSGSFIVYVKNGSTGALMSNYVGVNVKVGGLLA
jgi:hypothetical protein